MITRRRLSPRESGLVCHLRADRAANILIQSYADCAGEEALFRALLSERDMKPERARFWIDVYEQISTVRHPRA